MTLLYRYVYDDGSVIFNCIDGVFFLGISSILPIADGSYCIHFHSLPTLGWMKGSVSRVATLENLDILVNQEIGERI